MQSWQEVRAWRKEQRGSLIQHRISVARDKRKDWSSAITDRLGQVPLLVGRAKIIGFYWPFKGEYDPRPLARSLHHQGVRLALPVVVESARPLAFREWWPDMRMRSGVWDIPVPDEGDWVQPGTLLVPLLGFDRIGYRLGYGCVPGYGYGCLSGIAGSRRLSRSPPGMYVKYNLKVPN